MIKNKELKSNLLLGISLVIFGVFVPIINGKIDYWKHQGEIYERNLLNSEFQRIIGNWAVDIHQTIAILKDHPMTDDPKNEITLNRIQNYYLKKAQSATANMYFLSTEAVNNDIKPSKERYEEIKKNIGKNAPEIQQEFDTFLNNFNKDYQKALTSWDNFKIAAYILAILFHFWGISIGLKKNDSNVDLAKDVRGLNHRINILIKKINKKS